MLIKFLQAKPRQLYYHEWLKNNPDVIGKNPALVASVADDIDLELYLGDTQGGKNDYVTAVVAIRKGERVFRFKYDTGRLINEGLDSMAEDCLHHIHAGWDIEEWRKWGLNTFVRETSGFDRWLFGI